MNKQEALELIVEQSGRGELVFPTNMTGALKLQQALDDPDCHLDAAAELVLAEPLVAARLVAISNSVAYTRFGGHVTDVQTAVKLLGFKPLRALVAAIVVRQLGSGIADVSLRDKADLLWRHCANVAALSKVIAREFTDIDPETAMFAGIIHEIEGFYLLSRAIEFPALLDVDRNASSRELQALLARNVMRVLKIPKPVIAAVETILLDKGCKPPVSTGDVLSLANALAMRNSHLPDWPDVDGACPVPELEFALDNKTLSGVLRTTDEEVKAMTDTLLR